MVITVLALVCQVAFLTTRIVSATGSIEELILNDAAITVLANAGEQILLPCQSTSKVLWTYYNASASKEEEITSGELVLPKFGGRYAMNVTSSNNSRNLVIHESDVEYSGMYSCHDDEGIGKRYDRCLIVRATSSSSTISVGLSGSETCSESRTTIIVLSVFLGLPSMGLCFILVVYFRQRRRCKISTCSNQHSSHRSIGTKRTTGNNVKTKLTEQQQLLLLRSATSATEGDALNKNDNALVEATANIEIEEEQKDVRFINVKTLVAGNHCPGIFNSLNDKLYFVCPKHKQLHVYNFDETCSKSHDIPFPGVVQPCAFAVNVELKCLYIGDNEKSVIFRGGEGSDSLLTEWLTLSHENSANKIQLLDISCMSHGRLAVLSVEKCWDNRLGKGRLEVFTSGGGSLRVLLPEFVLSPWCMKYINNDLFVLSYGMLDTCGVVVFDLNGNVKAQWNSSKVSAVHQLHTPYFMQYDRETRALITVDPGRSEIMLVKIIDDSCRLVLSKVWTKPGTGSLATDRRPVRVHYSDKRKLLAVGMECGDVHLFEVDSVCRDRTPSFF